jgi:hypothetical protein
MLWLRDGHNMLCCQLLYSGDLIAGNAKLWVCSVQVGDAQALNICLAKMAPCNHACLCDCRCCCACCCMLWCSPTDAPLPLLSFAIATLCIEKLHVGQSSTTAHLKSRSSVVSTCGSPVSVTFLQACNHRK